MAQPHPHLACLIKNANICRRSNIYLNEKQRNRLAKKLETAKNRSQIVFESGISAENNNFGDRMRSISDLELVSPSSVLFIRVYFRCVFRFVSRFMPLQPAVNDMKARAPKNTWQSKYVKEVRM